MARIGYGQTRTDILDMVEELLNKLNVKKMFGNSNRPSIKWYTLFMARHPDLRMRMTSALSHARCNVSCDNLKYWFNELKDYLAKLNMQIYWKIRVDYITVMKWRFLLVPKTKKVIASKHDKHVYQGRTTSNKTQIMVLLAVSATAHYVKPLVVYLGVQPRRELCDDFHN